MVWEALAITSVPLAEPGIAGVGDRGGDGVISCRNGCRSTVVNEDGQPLRNGRGRGRFRRPIIDVTEIAERHHRGSRRDGDGTHHRRCRVVVRIAGLIGGDGNQTRPGETQRGTVEFRGPLNRERHRVARCAARRRQTHRSRSHLIGDRSEGDGLRALLHDPDERDLVGTSLLVIACDLEESRFAPCIGRAQIRA